MRERSLFFDSVYVYLHSPHPTILTGDFNCVENNSLDREPPSTRNDPTQTLRELYETFGVQDTLRLVYGNARLFTRRQGNTQSRLDRFYACSSVKPLSEYTHPGLSSDHDVVVLETNNTTITTHGKGRWKNNAAIYNEQSFKIHLQHKWRQWCTLQPFLFQTKTEWWTQIKSRIKNLLIQHAKLRQSTERRRETDIRRKVEALCRDENDNPTLLPIYNQLKKQWSKLKQDQVNAKVKNPESTNLKA